MTSRCQVCGSNLKYRSKQICILCFNTLKFNNLSLDFLYLIPLRRYNNTCTVCLEGITNVDDLIRCTKCYNEFHDDCILEWLESDNRCPMCRHPCV